MRYARLFVPYRGYWDISVDLDSIAFVNAGKKEEQNDNPKKAAKKGAKAKNTPQSPLDAPAPDEKDMPF